MDKFIFTIPLTLISGLIYGQLITPEKAARRTLDKDYLEYDTLDITIQKTHYSIYPSGKLIKENSGKITEAKLSAEYDITKAYVTEYLNQTFIFYTDSDMEVSGSWAEAFDQDLKTIWFASIPGFNLGAPIIKDKFAYVTAIGFVGKLNLTSGVYEWKFDDLYNHSSQEFNYFDKPEFNGKFIEFRSPHFRSKQVSRVIVNDQTGERIE